jgi:transposase-like protein
LEERLTTARQTTNTAKYNKILSAAMALTIDDREHLYNALRDILFPNRIPTNGLNERLKERRFHKGLSCPHCAHEKIYRHGAYRDRQRYRCRECRKTFNDATGTPLAGTHLTSKWIDYIECMVDGLSLRKICDKLEISLTTAFTWRHKVLNALKRMERTNFKGVLEVDETHLLESRKGDRNITGRASRERGGKSSKRGISNDQDCILVARDRTGQTHAQLACRGRISLRQAKLVLGCTLEEVTVLCSDAHGTWKAFARGEGINHIVLNASKKRRVSDVYHIQNVNSFHGRFKGWLDRFNGVSSKFLDNYLTWFSFLDAHCRESSTSKRDHILATACMTPAIETYQVIRDTTFAFPA